MQDPELNNAQYLEALKDLRGSGDTVSSRVWWDVADNTEGVLTADRRRPDRRAGHASFLLAEGPPNIDSGDPHGPPDLIVSDGRSGRP